MASNTGQLAGAGAAAGSVVPGVGTAIGGLIGAGAGVLGDIFGGIFSGADRQKALDLYKEAYEKMTSLGLPPEEGLPLILEEFKQAGMYSPEIEQAIVQATSAVSEMEENPEMRESQINALNLIKDRAEMGMTAEDRAAMNEITDQGNREIEAQEADIIRNMQQRGQAGSGAELAARLSTVQSGANRMADQSDRQAAIASQRALEAIKMQADLSSGIRNQDFNVDLNKASAEDELNRFNTQNQITRQQRNVGSTNEAQQMNLGRQQSVADKNIAMRNQEELRQRMGGIADWGREVDLASAQAGAAQKLGGVYAGEADRTAKSVGNIAKGLGDAAQGGYSHLMAGSGTPDTITPTSKPLTQQFGETMQQADNFGRSTNKKRGNFTLLQ